MLMAVLWVRWEGVPPPGDAGSSASAPPGGCRKCLEWMDDGRYLAYFASWKVLEGWSCCCLGSCGLSLVICC